MHVKTKIAESRGEKPQPRGSFLKQQQERLACRRSMIADASTTTGLFGELEDEVENA